MLEKTECNYSDTPVCPYCGHKDQDWCDGRNDEGDSVQSCPSCGKDYKRVFEIVYEFTTEPMEGWDEE